MTYTSIFKIAFLLILINSCSNIDLKNDQKYMSYINYFNPVLTSHFPKSYESFVNDYSYVVDTTAHFNTEEINITFYNAKEQINTIKYKYRKHELFSSHDDCIIVVNDFLNKSNLILDDNKEYRSKYSNNCIGHNVIPNFWNHTDSIKNTNNGLDNDFKYLIIESKMGVFSKKINTAISSLPNEVKHGYSKGIAFNDKENIIIYWMIVW